MKVTSKSISGPASRLILEFDMMDNEDRIRAHHATHAEDLWSASFKFGEWLLKKRKHSDDTIYDIYDECVTMFYEEFEGLLDE